MAAPQATVMNSRRLMYGLPQPKVSPYHTVLGKGALCFTANSTANVSIGSILSKKSPRRSCRIEMRNNRITRHDLLNQCCVSRIVLESILLGDARKIFFRQHRSDSYLRRFLPHDRFGPHERTWPDHLAMSQKCHKRL